MSNTLGLRLICDHPGNLCHPWFRRFLCGCERSDVFCVNSMAFDDAMSQTGKQALNAFSRIPLAIFSTGNQVVEAVDLRVTAASSDKMPRRFRVR